MAQKIGRGPDYGDMRGARAPAAPSPEITWPAVAHWFPDTGTPRLSESRFNLVRADFVRQARLRGRRARPTNGLRPYNTPTRSLGVCVRSRRILQRSQAVA